MAFGKHQKGAHAAGSHFSDAGSHSTHRRPAANEGSGIPRPAVGPDPLETDAPRPIGVDPEATGSFEKLDAGEGAILTTRENADDAADAAREHLSGTAGMRRLDAKDLPQLERREDEAKAKRSRKMIALLVVLTAAVILGAIYLFSRLLATPASNTNQGPVEQTQTDVSSKVEYYGVTYYLQQGDDGSWQLMRQSEDEGAQAQQLGSLQGTPVTIVLYNGALLIPENKSDGTWDVLSYVLGSGWSQLVDSDGNAYSGQGSINSATLDGSQLTITSDGGSTTIPLEW